MAKRDAPEKRLSLRCPDCGYWLDATPRGGFGRALAALLKPFRRQERTGGSSIGADKGQDLWCWKCRRVVPAGEAAEKWVDVKEWDEPE